VKAWPVPFARLNECAGTTIMISGMDVDMAADLQPFTVLSMVLTSRSLALKTESEPMEFQLCCCIDMLACLGDICLWKDQIDLKKLM